MHFSDAERVINRRIQNPLEREANLILIESRDAAVHNQAIKDVKELMKGDSVLTSGCYYPAANALGLNTRLIWVFMIVIAIGTVLFAARIQFASVIERRRGIAMLRVLGWKTRTIIIQLLFESLIQSTAGSLMGIIAGSLVLLLVPVNQLLGIDATMTGVFSASLCLAVFLFAVIAGTLAGLLPGILIVRQRPYDVLRRA
jgi:ABC-type antimicrobial peptide transport system permease subunit